MAGIDNLKSLKDRTTEEQREIAAKGGKASQAVQAEKRTFRTIFESLLKENIDIDKFPELAKHIEAKTALTADKAMSMAMMLKALQGSEKAFELVRDTIGEKPTDKIEFENAPVVLLEIISMDKPE